MAASVPGLAAHVIAYLIMGGACGIFRRSRFRRVEGELRNGRAGTGARVRQGSRGQKDVKNVDRSGDVYENKEQQDIMTENKRDNESEDAEVLQKNAVS